MWLRFTMSAVFHRKAHNHIQILWVHSSTTSYSNIFLPSTVQEHQPTPPSSLFPLKVYCKVVAAEGGDPYR